jgi:excisionase family DNA binding protein
MPEITDTASRWLTLGEASQFLGVHTGTLRDWVDAGAIPSFRTPGGHRRFDVGDLHTFLQRRKSLGADPALAMTAPNPLEGVRQQLGSGGLARQRWYHRLSAEQRARERETGQRMFGLLIQYASRRENADHFLEEGRAIARAYGHDLAQVGLAASDMARAFIFIRRAILHATHQPQDATAPYDPEGLRLYQRINSFMDEMLLDMLEAYEKTQARIASKLPRALKPTPPKRKK